jgi:hypothetical protein
MSLRGSERRLRIRIICLLTYASTQFLVMVRGNCVLARDGALPSMTHVPLQVRVLPSPVRTPLQVRVLPSPVRTPLQVRVLPSPVRIPLKGSLPNSEVSCLRSGGELLLMGTTGEPSRYYPMDSNGLAVGQTPPVACVCLVALVPDVCAPLGYGGCGGGQCEEMPSIWFPVDRENCWLQIPPIPLPRICSVGGRFGSCIAVCPPGSGAYCIEVRGNVTCFCDNGGSCTANCKEGSCRVTCPPGSVAVCICEADLAVCGCRPVRPRV